MHPLLNIAVRAAREAGKVMMRSWSHLDRVSIEQKGRNDFVTEVDRTAEAAVIQTIHRVYPEHSILAEESGITAGRKGGTEVEWIIDPIDGTTNYIHQFPQFCVSIGIRERGQLEHGVVYNPFSQELYTASRGRGAQLDGRKIRVSNKAKLDGALIATGFPFKSHQDFDAYLPMFAAVVKQTRDVRRAGSAALDLAFVAAGRLDGFFEFGLQVWDIAAGTLLVREAGGIVADYDGGDPLTTGNCVAGAPKVQAMLLKTLKDVSAEPPIKQN